MPIHFAAIVAFKSSIGKQEKHKQKFKPRAIGRIRDSLSFCGHVVNAKLRLGVVSAHRVGGVDRGKALTPCGWP